MEDVSTHEIIGKERRKLFDADSKKVISTRNLVPNKRTVNQLDIDRMAKLASGRNEKGGYTPKTEIKNNEVDPPKSGTGEVEQAKKKRGRPRKEEVNAVSEQ